MARSSRASSHAAGAVALTIAIVGGASVSAHRQDEYLQAARLAIDRGAVHLEMDLTPGIALAEATITEIDGNRDGSLSQDEQSAYGKEVLGRLEVAVDGMPLHLELAAVSFPDDEAMRRGEGTIRLQSAATLPHLAAGTHQLWFRNSHHANRSVYLANALVPESDDVAVTAQRRDGEQRALTIEYVLRPATATATPARVLGTVAIAAALLAMLRQSSRSARQVPAR